jgi:putative Mg2+ transporter-C (MgtC) family protein
MACGAGLFLPAVIATVIVLVAMAVIGFVEWKVSLKSYSLIYEARGVDETTMLSSLLHAMDKEHCRLGQVDRDVFGTVHRVSFTHAATRRRHERLRLRLLSEPGIEVLMTYPDAEED